jgi:hypothetical protein
MLFDDAELMQEAGVLLKIALKKRFGAAAALC